MGRPSNGIIAGCTQSNHFARIFLHAIISAVHEASPYNDQPINHMGSLWEGAPQEWNKHLPRRPWNDIRTFVDDVSQTVRAKWPVMKMVRAAQVLKTQALSDGLIISTKTVVLASDQKEGRAVVRLSLIHI